MLATCWHWKQIARERKVTWAPCIRGEAELEAGEAFQGGLEFSRTPRRGEQ